MRGAIRERPRVVIAQVLGVLVLLAVGFALGGAMKSESDPNDDPGVQQRIERLERSSARLERELKAAGERADKADAATRRQARGFQRRLRRAAVRERHFRAALRRARAD